MFPFWFHTKLVRNFRVVIELVDRLPVSTRYEMAADINGDIDRRVPHLLLDGGETPALLNQEGCEGTTEKMEMSLC
jgi:hypothetical protein